MAYTPIAFGIDEDEVTDSIVETIMGRERDIYYHELNLQRYEEILKKKDFVGSTDDNGLSFRDKIEKEIPVLKGRIEELKTLIETEQKLGKIPTKEKIQQSIERINAKNLITK